MNRAQKLIVSESDSSGHLWLKIKDPVPTVEPGSIVRLHKAAMRVLRVRWRALLLAAVVSACVIGIYYTRPRPDPCPRHSLQHEHLSHVAYYCNPIDKGPETGKEGSVSPDKYTLEQVHVVIRHGDRYRLHSLPNHDMPALSCDIDRFPEIETHVPEVKGYVKAMKENAQKIQLKTLFQKFALYPNKGRCEDGHLTPKGAAQHIRNGAFLRKAYVDKWDLFSAQDRKQVHMISTVRQRTFQSALALLYGLLPDLDLNNVVINSAPDARMCVNSDKQFPCHCYAVQRFIDITDGSFGQNHISFTGQAHVADAYRDLSQALNAPLKALPRATHVMDVAMVSACHALPLPGRAATCMRPESVRHIVEAVNDNGWRVQNHSVYSRIVRLRMLPLLHDILVTMETRIPGVSPRPVQGTPREGNPRFVLHSGHDSTVAPLISALNISDGVWPPYAARLNVEMYSTKQKEAAAGKPDAQQEAKQYFVRFLYNGKDVTKKVLFCRGRTLPEFDDMCPLKYYQDFMKYKDGLADLKINKYTEACSKAITLT